MVASELADQSCAPMPAPGTYYCEIEAFGNDRGFMASEASSDSNWRVAWHRIFPQLQDELECSVTLVLGVLPPSTHGSKGNPLGSEVVDITLRTEQVGRAGQTQFRQRHQRAIVVDRNSSNHGSLLISTLAVPRQAGSQDGEASGEQEADGGISISLSKRYIMQTFSPPLELQLVVAKLTLQVREEAVPEEAASSSDELCCYSDFASTTSSSASQEPQTMSRAALNSTASAWNSSRGARVAVSVARELTAKTVQRTWSVSLSERRPDGSGAYASQPSPLNDVREHVTKRSQERNLADSWTSRGSSEAHGQTRSSVVSSENFDLFMFDASRNSEALRGWQKAHRCRNERTYYIVDSGAGLEDNRLSEVQKLRQVNRLLHASSEEMNRVGQLPRQGSELSSEALCMELALALRRELALS
eukprot:TRINITY_DN30125_c0_g1_i1.p1 TRINITY_DN30125_c0_g1~~TRINITY_DN30125_c0_g1_i1.p1  ORF type:complete len:417 (+),score=78.09 TRINITY_DN30125_c0_g1_i1:41-1291(+)